MSELAAEKLIFGAGLYGAIGLVVAVLFLGFGISKHDHAAKGMSLPSRLLLAPGVIMLWPIMVDIWMFGGRNEKIRGSRMTKQARRAHFWIWALLGPIVMLLFFASIRLMPTPVYEDPDVVERLIAEPN